MYEENKILCVSNAYEKKYYLNEEFNGLPDSVKDELKIMCVLFTEEVGGLLTLEYDEDGNLLIKTETNEGDLLYDDISCGLLMKRIQNEKQELSASLELFYKVFFLGQEEILSEE